MSSINEDAVEGINFQNLKNIVDGAVLRQFGGVDVTGRQGEALFAQVMGERGQLFANLLSEKQALFAAMVGQMGDHRVITTKALDLSAVEVSEEAIAAKIVQELSPEIAATIEALVVQILASKVNG